MEYLTEPEVYSLLSSYSLPVPKYEVFSRDEFPKWAFFPAYLKVVSKEIVHKSNVGGVVKVSSRGELLTKIGEFKEKFKDVKEFLLVEELKGIEAFLGVKRNSAFLHVIAVGIGGIYVELFKDAVFLPLSSTRNKGKPGTPFRLS